LTRVAVQARYAALARWRRKLKRLLLGLFGLVAIVVTLAFLALAHLDARPMRSWVRGAAAARGVALDFDVGRVTIGGLRFASVRIASPAADAAVAPDLASIGAIEGRWSPLAKRIDELVIRDVALTVVRDADGTTSLDRWIAGLPPSSPSTEPSDPLSALASALVPAGVELHARIEGVTVTVIDRDGRGGVAQRMTLTGPTVKADVAGGGVALALGPSTLRLALAPGSGAAEARELVADLRGEVTLAASGHGSVSLEAALQRQTLAPALPPIKQLVSLAGTIDFDPAQRRTALHVERLQLLDGAATLTANARAEDVDTGGDPGIRPVIEQLALRIDLPAIARAVPAELGPVEVEGEPLVVTIKDAAGTPSPQGTLAASGTLVRARWRDLSMRGLRLGVDAQPVGQGGARGELRLALAELALPGTTVRELDATLGGEHPAGAPGAPGTIAAAGVWPVIVTGRATVGAIDTPAQHVQGVTLTTRATARSASALDGELTADVTRVEAGAAGTALMGTHVEVSARDVVLGTPLLASAGTVHVQGTIAGARDATGLAARAVAFTADAALTGAAPLRTSATFDASQLVVPGLATSLGPAFAGGPVHVAIDAPAIALVAADLARSHGTARLTGRYGGASLEATATGSADDVAWVISGRAPRLGPSRDVVVSSRGSVRPADVRITHDTQLQLGATATADAALRGARIHVVSSGTTRQHEATISAELDAPSSGGRTFPSARFEVVTSVDLARGAASVHLTGTEPAADLRVTAALDAARAIHWQARGRLTGLAAAATLLPPGPDWARLAVELDGHGVASGIVARVAGGVPVLVADPATALRGHQAMTITVRDVHYADAALTRADVDKATLAADVELGAARTAVVTLDVPALAAVSRGVKLGASALAVRLDATLGAHGVARGVDARLTLRAASASQSVVPWYAIVDPALELTVAGDPDATLAVAMHLANPGAGTAFDVAGDLERGGSTPAAGVVARNSLALEGTLAQDLDRLDAVPDRMKARGKLRVPFRVESGDLSVFRTAARIALDHVGLELPAARLRLTEINGELPVVQEIVVGSDGIARVGQGEHGPFSQLRFPDYRPFAGDTGYLSIGQVAVRDTTFGPVAGNARVDHDVVALDQLELAALAGKITGQCLAELRGADTRLVFRGKLTGLRVPAPGAAADGDPLDANLAIALTPYRYGLEGRAEIVRIGRDHLRALLDVSDPYHADVAANRVRLALAAGYPKQVRLGFASGFASLAIELGGLAGVVRIDELRGIPIGPALAHWLAPILEP
jgi:translocation and assembly module TamB